MSEDQEVAVAPFALDPLLMVVRERSTGIGSHIHGELHWRTVGANGLWLAGSVDDVDIRVVVLFALLHDTMRQNDGHDPEHGRRAAAFADELHMKGCSGSRRRNSTSSCTLAPSTRTEPCPPIRQSAPAGTPTGSTCPE